MRNSRWSRASLGKATVGAALLACVSVSAAPAVQSSATPPPSTAGPSVFDATALFVPPEVASADATQLELTLHQAATAPADVTDTGDSGDTVIDQTKAQRVAAVSADTHYGIPRAALVAYRTAGIVMAKTDAECHLPWSILAAIGQVESDQGRYAMSHVLADGTTSPPIVGMRLDGSNGTATIPDTDGGKLDGDTKWDRAVGPMQFLPSTWAVVGVDGDGDGVRDPDDFDDAALAAGVYLCAGHRDLGTKAGTEAAVYSYNHSDAYVSLVLSLAKRFARGGVVVLPNDTTPGTPSGGDTGTPPSEPTPHKPGGVLLPGRHHHHHHHHHKPPHGGGHGNPDPGTPEVFVKGTLVSCVDDPPTNPVSRTLWCVDDGTGSVGLDLGTNADLTTVQGDYDADGTAEAVSDELTGLLGTHVKVRVDTVGLVNQVNGLPYQYVVAPPEPTPTDPTPTDPTPTEPTPTDPTPTDPTPTGPAQTQPASTPSEPTASDDVTAAPASSGATSTSGP